MPFNDTTNKNGIIQRIEALGVLQDGAISGDTGLLRRVTNIVNDAFDEILPLLFSYGDYLGFDDTNNTGTPTKTANIVSGTSSYQLLTDANSLNILNIVDVQVLQSATATMYISLERMTPDDDYVKYIINPDTTMPTGAPIIYVELNNTIYLTPTPNYNATNGLKVLFERDPSYFIYSDTTKKPGIPRTFHGLLALIAAHEFITEHDSQNSVLITRLEKKIMDRKAALRAMNASRNPSHNRLAMATSNFK